MWFPVVDNLLRELSFVGIFDLAYADDVIIICRADDEKVLFSLMHRTCIVKEWCKNGREITGVKEAN